MKMLIIFFSQSGSTQKAADAIAAGARGAGAEADLVDIGKADVSALAGYDLVGLGCPVFYYKEPFNVRDFIGGLPDQAGRHWFVFATHAAVLGTTLHSMTERLSARGATVIGNHHTYADALVPFYPYPTYTAGHPDEGDIEDARLFGEDIVKRHEKVAAGDAGAAMSVPPITEEWSSAEAEMLSLEFMRKVFPPFFVDAELCARCGDCEDACPVGGIDVSADPPRLQDPCVFCFNCVKACPEGALQADFGMLVGMAPGNYARYREALERAAERGEFRWHMDPDTADFDNPLYLQDKKR